MSTTARLSMDEYDDLVRRGVFDRLRVEFIQGELREMSPIGPDHEEVVDLLNEWSVKNKPGSVRIRIQNSIGLPELESAPEPDVVWVRQRSYRSGRPQPADVLLVVEVADSSVRYDTGEKADLYAEAGVGDYWVVNIPGRRLEVYRDPRGGKYQEVRYFTLSESVAPIAFPDLRLSVAMLFGA